MARIRQIKPEFYLDDELAKCSRDSRLLFIGLWVIADRRGRLEDRPAKIKAQVFPYDDDLGISEIDELLNQLVAGAFIIRYVNSGRKLIQIRTFEKHQHCHIKEPDSRFPGPENNGSEPRHSHSQTDQEPDKPGASTVQEPVEHRSSPAASGILSIVSGERNPPQTPPRGASRREALVTHKAAMLATSVIFKCWNSQTATMHHRSINGQEKAIAKVLSKYPPEEICLAIERYGEVRENRSGKYREVYAWTLGEFLTRKDHYNIERFNSDNWEAPFLAPEGKSSSKAMSADERAKFIAEGEDHEHQKVAAGNHRGGP